MPRYIDAEIAEKEITSLVAEYENRMPEWSPDDMLTSGKDSAMKYGYKADGAEKALEIVNKIPTADVQEVKHERWISVKDRLPEYDCVYIVCRSVGEHQICFAAHWDGGRWLSVVNNSQLDYITHWQPLPEPMNYGAKMDGGESDAD